jgi:hypothetical protein
LVVGEGEDTPIIIKPSSPCLYSPPPKLRVELFGVGIVKKLNNIIHIGRRRFTFIESFEDILAALKASRTYNNQENDGGCYLLPGTGILSRK